MCNSANEPAISPISQLIFSAESIGKLPSDAGRSRVIDQFNEFRELLWSLIEMSPDPAPYRLAWKLIALHARADLLDFEHGNEDALTRIQEKVKEAIQLLP